MDSLIIFGLFIFIGFSLSFAKPIALPKKFATRTIQITKNGANLSMVTSNGINITIKTTNSVSKLRRALIYSKNSHHHLRLKKNGVDGLGTSNDPDAQLMIEAVGFGGQVRIRSVQGYRYLCVSDHGSFIIKRRHESNNDYCTFIEQYAKGYTVYRTKINNSWYLGVKNDGRMKSAKKTQLDQRSTHFLELD